MSLPSGIRQITDLHEYLSGLTLDRWLCYNSQSAREEYYDLDLGFRSGGCGDQRARVVRVVIPFEVINGQAYPARLYINGEGIEQQLSPAAEEEIARECGATSLVSEWGGLFVDITDPDGLNFPLLMQRVLEAEQGSDRDIIDWPFERNPPLSGNHDTTREQQLNEQLRERVMEWLFSDACLKYHPSTEEAEP